MDANELATAKASLLEYLNINFIEKQRADGLLEKLKSINAIGHTMELWFEDMLHHFAAELTFNHNRLFYTAHNWQNLPLIAFGARNMLELNVWIAYCAKSIGHAKQFYDDKFRDGIAFMNALKRLLHSANHLQSDLLISEGIKTINELANSVGAEAPDADYTKVVQAASELGVREYFISLNTILSKFAHPTSMVVLNYLTKEYEGSLEGIATFFKLVGIDHEIAGWKLICATIEARGVKV